MAWTAEKVKEMRESNPSKAAESSGWTAEKVRAIRTKTPNPSTASSTVPPKSNIYADALQQYTERHISDMGEVDARNEPSQSLTRQLPLKGEPLACRASFRWTLEVLRGVKWRALLQRTAAAALRGRCRKRQPGRWTWGGSGAFRRRAGTCWRTWAAGPWPTAPAGRRS